jgi:hypothetical protein
MKSCVVLTKQDRPIIFSRIVLSSNLSFSLLLLVFNLRVYDFGYMCLNIYRIIYLGPSQERVSRMGTSKLFLRPPADQNRSPCPEPVPDPIRDASVVIK